MCYKKKFLESYIPGTTYYLSQDIRHHLMKIGSLGSQEYASGTYAKKIFNRLLIDLSWNSSRLEGNTYSLLETEKLLLSGEETSGKNDFEAQMILNHKDAIEFLVDMSEAIAINRFTVLNIHALLSNNLLANPNACGQLRSSPVKIGLSVYHPLEIPQLIEECFEMIIAKASLITDPYEQSFFLLIHLPYLKPFLDVNKRVSRLAGNIMFIKRNLSPLTFVDVPEEDYVKSLLCIYELNEIEPFRDLFVWAYERSASLYMSTLETLGKPNGFKLKYRHQIKEAICSVVDHCMNKLQAAQFIAEFAQRNLPSQDAVRFVEVTEYELSCLHEGNFARFKIHPTQFFTWFKSWN